MCRTCLLFFLVSSQAFSQIVFIVNKNNPLEKISKDEIRRIYLKKSLFWDNGKKIRPFDYVVHESIRTELLKTYLNQTVASNIEYWLEQKTLNGNVAPLQIRGQKKMLNIIKAFPSAIGYVNESMIDSHWKKIIKPLKESK